LTATSWDELIDELENDHYAIRVIEASFGHELDHGIRRVTLSVEAPETGRIYRMTCTLDWDGVSLDDSYAQPEEATSVMACLLRFRDPE
jgi:hypothetical protein